mmetsp:Transcript_18265/g.62961  ORF Transcript_18265/g.62961 Transcript_18265/m.62961 type:complete len:119 (+) Transcript_18265:855-1211(+)
MGPAPTGALKLLVPPLLEARGSGAVRFQVALAWSSMALKEALQATFAFGQASEPPERPLKRGGAVHCVFGFSMDAAPGGGVVLALGPAPRVLRAEAATLHRRIFDVAQPAKSHAPRIF